MLVLLTTRYYLLNGTTASNTVYSDLCLPPVLTRTGPCSESSLRNSPACPGYVVHELRAQGSVSVQTKAVVIMDMNGVIALIW